MGKGPVRWSSPSTSPPQEATGKSTSPTAAQEMIRIKAVANGMPGYHDWVRWERAPRQLRLAGEVRLVVCSPSGAAAGRRTTVVGQSSYLATGSAEGGGDSGVAAGPVGHCLEEGIVPSSGSAPASLAPIEASRLSGRSLGCWGGAETRTSNCSTAYSNRVDFPCAFAPNGVRGESFEQVNGSALGCSFVFALVASDARYTACNACVGCQQARTATNIRGCLPGVSGPHPDGAGNEGHSTRVKYAVSQPGIPTPSRCRSDSAKALLRRSVPRGPVAGCRAMAT